jgi:hypothetical protein
MTQHYCGTGQFPHEPGEGCSEFATPVPEPDQNAEAGDPAAWDIAFREGHAHGLALGAGISYQEAFARTVAMLSGDPGSGADAAPAACICKHFRDTGGVRVGDLCCPVHGVDGPEPTDGPWDGCAAHGAHPHDGMRCLDCPDCAAGTAPDAAEATQ